MKRRIVPVDIIFSRALHSGEIGIEKQYIDVPIINLEPHMSAALYALHGEGSLDFYRNWQSAMNPEDIGSVHENVGEWEKEVLRQIETQCSEVPVVERLERDRLILSSGEVACCMAKLSDKGWIEVDMPEDVAELWDKRSVDRLQEIIRKEGYKPCLSYPYLSKFRIFNRIIIRQRRKMIYSPILHPDYHKWGFCRVGSNRLDLIRKFLGPVQKKLSLLDIGCNTGYFDFHFARQGFDVTGLDATRKHFEMGDALKETYSLDVDFRFGKLEEFNSEKRFDIVLGMSILYHLLGWGDQTGTPMTPVMLGGKLEELVGHALVWESGYEPQREIDVIRDNSGLAHYTKLGLTEGAVGTYKEIGVFTREPIESTQKYFRDIS